MALAGCDVSYQSDLVRVDNLPVVDTWSPEEDHVWGALDDGCNMSVRRYSLYNPVPWMNGGVLSLLGVLAQLKMKVSLLGVLATI